MPPLGPRRLAGTNTAPVAHVRGGRKRNRRSYLTKKTFLGTTTLQMRWEIVHLYAYQGVRGWAELSRRFSALHPRSPRNYQTCRRVVNLWQARLRVRSTRHDSFVSPACLRRLSSPLFCPFPAAFALTMLREHGPA